MCVPFVCLKSLLGSAHFLVIKVDRVEGCGVSGESSNAGFRLVLIMATSMDVA